MTNDVCTSEDLHPHVDTDTCARCRKKLQKGHRIMMINIVDRAGVDYKDLGRRGLYLFDEYEFIHVDCHDPLLKRGVSIE